MFRAATDHVKTQLQYLTQSLDKSMQTMIDAVYKNIVNDYLRVLTGTNGDSLLQTSRAEKALRLALLPLIAGFDGQFENIDGSSGAAVADQVKGDKAPGEDDDDDPFASSGDEIDDPIAKQLEDNRGARQVSLQAGPGGSAAPFARGQSLSSSSAMFDAPSRQASASPFAPHEPSRQSSASPFAPGDAHQSIASLVSPAPASRTQNSFPANMNLYQGGPHQASSQRSALSQLPAGNSFLNQTGRQTSSPFGKAEGLLQGRPSATFAQFRVPAPPVDPWDDSE